MSQILHKASIVVFSMNTHSCMSRVTLRARAPASYFDSTILAQPSIMQSAQFPALRVSHAALG
jgi:hypothetical protein